MNQLSTYRRDKQVEPSERQQILSPDRIPKGRRPKHHWDRVSALIWCCWAAKSLPARFRPGAVAKVVDRINSHLPPGIEHFDDLDGAQRAALFVQLQKDQIAQDRASARQLREAEKLVSHQKYKNRGLAVGKVPKIRVGGKRRRRW